MTHRRFTITLPLLALGVWLSLITGAMGNEPVTVTIGTGGVTGIYHSTGRAIAKILDRNRIEHGIQCNVESTDGSVFNINAVVSGKMELGLAQSDRQYQAFHGSPGSEWAGLPQNNLRAIFSLHDEICNLIAAADTGTRTVADLKGKRVAIGNPGSGHRKNAIDALTAAGLDWQQDLTVDQNQAMGAPALLQKKLIDAFFYTIGHPSAVFKETTMGARQVMFIPIDGPGIDALLASVPYYTRAVIPVLDNYFGALNSTNVPSFGVKATLVTSKNVPDTLVYSLVKEIFENIEIFKKLHPSLNSLSKEQMLQGLSAPIHPGAKRYYQEQGMP